MVIGGLRLLPVTLTPRVQKNPKPGWIQSPPSSSATRSSIAFAFPSFPMLSLRPRLIFFFDGFLFLDSTSCERLPPSSKCLRGNPAPLKAVAFVRRLPPRRMLESKFLDFRRKYRGLGFQNEAELLKLVEGDGLSSENGDSIELGKNHYARTFDSVVDDGTARVGGKELDDEKGKFCAPVGNLNAGDLVKRVITLPIEERVKILDLFESDEKSFTISDYNDILTALVKAGEFESAINLFSELPSRGVTPDCWTFSVMVHCLCKKNRPDEAKRVLEEMVGRGFLPNAVTFSRLINCLCKRGRVQKAFEVFEIVNQVGCEPSIRMYNSLISGLCYVGRLEEALELLKKIKNSTASPDMHTYRVVIDGFCMVGRSDEALELLKEAAEKGLEPNAVTYNSVLNGYCKEGRPLEGLQLLKEMQRGGCPPDFTSFSTVLQGLLKGGQISAAWRTYKKMKDAGFQVEEQAVDALLRGVCMQPVIDEKVLNDATELFEAIREISQNPSPYTCCLMIQALAKGGELDEALFHLHEMVRNGYSPRTMTYNIILRILCEVGRCDDAMSILVLMIERDTFPSRSSFSIMLDELCRQGRILDLLGVYAAAIKRDKQGVNIKKVIQKYEVN